MAALSVKRSITKFENTENSCPKMKLYFKKSFKRIKVLNSMATCPKAKFGSSGHRLVAIIVTLTVILTYV